MARVPHTFHDNPDRTGPNHRFGDLVFDPSASEVRGPAMRRRLRPMAAHALSILIARRGSIVTRDEFRDALWRGQYVEWEMGLHQVIRQLRKALGDDARNPRWLETVPRRGYRLKCADDVTLLGRKTNHRNLGRNAMMLALGALTPPFLLLLACLLFAA